MKFSLTCCATAKQQLEMKCEQHGFYCPDQVLRYFPESEDQCAWFGLIAENATYRAFYCPWCRGELHSRNIPNIMANVALKKIPEQTVSIYHGDEFVGEATYIELNDLRIQIKNNQAIGWRVVWMGEIIPIDHKSGKLHEWPKGMFDLMDEQLMELI